MGAAGNAGSAASQDDFEIPPEVAELLKLQERALEAYDVLHTTFTIHPDGSESYQDDFAGTWVNAPYLHIALTSDAPETVGRYRELLKDYEDIVVYETAKYSLNYLDSIRFNFSEIMRSNYSITSHYVDVMENRIVFEVEDLDEKSINASLSSAMKNTELKNVIPSDLFMLKQGKPKNPDFDLIGGARNNVGSNNTSDFITLGICGNFIYNGNSYSGYITSGHNLPEGTTLHRNTSSSTIPQIGKVIKANYGNGYVGDYALVSRTDLTTNLTNQVLVSSTVTTYIRFSGLFTAKTS